MNPIPLWPHQSDAVAFSKPRAASILECGMGTGKTRMGHVLRLEWSAHLTLVVCPLAVLIDETWKREARKLGIDDLDFCAPTRGTVKQKAQYVSNAIDRSYSTKRPLMVVVTWDVIWREPMLSLMLKTRWDAAFGDESHRAKGPQSKTSKAGWKIFPRVRRRVLTTGTLNPHSPLDVFAQARMVRPEILGTSYVRFRATYARLDTRGGFPKIVGYQNLEHLASVLSELVYCVDRSVLKLPPAIHNEIFVDLEPKTRKLYDQVEDGIVAEIEGGVVDAANGGVRVMRLQQITGGGVGIESDVDLGARVVATVGTEKRDALLDFLEDLPENEPVVVFGYFLHDLAVVHDVARELKRPSLELSGERKEHRRWAEGEATILAVQVKAGSAGIDLTRARYCVLLSTGTLSPGDYDQCLARLDRTLPDGSMRTVWYYHLIARDTIDVAMYAARRKKREPIEYVIGYLRDRQARVLEEEAAP